MGTSLNAFMPNSKKTQTLSATSTTGSATLDATDVSSSTTITSAMTSYGKDTMRIVNAGPNIVFLVWGTGAQTATTGCMPMLPNTIELFSKAWSDNTVAGICASGQTATVYVTCGEGS
jgi:hypothetical protein